MEKTPLIGYETTFILRPDVNDERQKSFLEKLKGIIETHQGEVLHSEDLGRKKLAYPIQKETRGYYSFLVYSGNNTVVQEIERNCRINEDVIRFLTVKIAQDFNPKEFKRTEWIGLQ